MCEEKLAVSVEDRRGEEEDGNRDGDNELPDRQRQIESEDRFW